jgi:hypothetical protein
MGTNINNRALLTIAVVMVGGERTTCASTASSLNLRRANARRPLTHIAVVTGSGAALLLSSNLLHQETTELVPVPFPLSKHNPVKP